MLATLQKPPPVGSAQEVLLILLWLQREQKEHAQTRAILQAMINKDKISEAFDDYKKTCFPWIESSKIRDRALQIKRLMEEVGRGPITVTAQAPPSKLRSRLRTQALSRTPGVAEAEQKKIYEKLGSTVPR